MLTINEIKRKVRDIEIAYDYDHSIEDYNVTVNLTEIANLIKNLIDDK